MTFMFWFETISKKLKYRQWSLQRKNKIKFFFCLSFWCFCWHGVWHLTKFLQQFVYKALEISWTMNLFDWLKADLRSDIIIYHEQLKFPQTDHWEVISPLFPFMLNGMKYLFRSWSKCTKFWLWQIVRSKKTKKAALYKSVFNWSVEHLFGNSFNLNLSYKVKQKPRPALINLYRYINLIDFNCFWNSLYWRLFMIDRAK